jgi:hypothetical protein
MSIKNNFSDLKLDHPAFIYDGDEKQIQFDMIKISKYDDGYHAEFYFQTEPIFTLHCGECNFDSESIYIKGINGKMGYDLI